ncbi:endopeptidase La [Desulfurivibrio dismutans]|uniref:endopeptidase La n=1 Tax=Desulfurivibrio dismutans TaxID=1398908 RepID=UPI0023DCD2B9|nr:endopeptidase La [Desulfurivibrio alkaliphilus]MDF1615005.1 endopeptidase La [Desulfurivibrio alkaliphilus]
MTDDKKDLEKPETEQENTSEQLENTGSQEHKGKKNNLANLPVPEEMPVLPLHGFVFFPGMGFPMQISHPSSQQLVDDAIIKDRLVAVVTHRRLEDESEEDSRPSEALPEIPATPKGENLYSMGVVGYIHKLIKSDDGVYQVLMSAVKKLRIAEYTQHTPYLRARVTTVPMEESMDKESEAMLLNIRNQFKNMADLGGVPKELSMTVAALTNPFYIAYLVISQVGLSMEEEEAVLEIEDLKELLNRVGHELNKKLETVEMSHKIQKGIKQDMDKKQREFFLREQLKAIRKELGEDDEKIDLKELRERLDKAELPEEPKKTAEKELDRLNRISPSSPEYTVSRTYLDWLIDLPWQTATEDNLDLKRAQEVMDADHYGLDDIKKRIIEFLAVRKLKQDMHGPILCFVGPPGVGKTSLGQSIARSMGRKFVRISLGGVRDEAEIRGHRRTYIGALPGRIIQSLRKAGSCNPLFMLDEIDKLGMDFRGDPSSALLEVLDPEQNFSFSDHYLEIPFDLSKVMFITTANMLDSIPGPLRDRMEVIELSGYTEEEKMHIARRHLVPKQLEAHAISEDDLRLDDEALAGIIRSYTREAGVRNLERKIGGVCRGVARKIVEGHSGLIAVSPKDLAEYLGPPQFFSESKARTWGPGLATGLAWTPVGGELLFIETARMKGKGNLSLTGKLGEVMKESANAALTYIRSHTDKLELDEKIFADNDIHVHVPEGAIPKDGPSAGVAMVVSLASQLTGKPVRREVAMTGEITLRGDVLPVGGIKEKVLAAVRADIPEVILPRLNEKDLSDLPESAKKKVKFHLVHDINEALKVALEPGEKK